MMFNRKKKKTGCETPELRKPTPPPPPTSGSNAVKPNINCCHQPTCTSTQNPPDTFSSLLKETSVQILPNDISTVTYICPYELPCGWCTKWDKKCDKKIGCTKDKDLNDIKDGRGLTLADIYPTMHSYGIRKEFTND